MKFGQVIEDNKIIFSKIHADNESGRLIPDLFWFLKKTLYEVKRN